MSASSKLVEVVQEVVTVQTRFLRKQGRGVRSESTNPRDRLCKLIAKKQDSHIEFAEDFDALLRVFAKYMGESVHMGHGASPSIHAAANLELCANERAQRRWELSYCSNSSWAVQLRFARAQHRTRTLFGL